MEQREPNRNATVAEGSALKCPERRAYARPSLVVLGPIKTLTAGFSVGITESGSNNTRGSEEEQDFF